MLHLTHSGNENIHSPENTYRVNMHVRALLTSIFLACNSVYAVEKPATPISCDIQQSKSYSLVRTGKDLGALHTKTYKELIADMETLLSHGSFLICDIHSGTRKMSTGEYRLSYIISYRDAGQELPHKHIELWSHVWREKGKAKTSVEARNEKELPAHKEKWEEKYSGVLYIPLQGGDDDLYQAGELFLATKKN